MPNLQVQTVINSTTEGFNGVAVDAVNPQIYYSTRDGKLYRANEDGTDISTVLEPSDCIVNMDTNCDSSNCVINRAFDGKLVPLYR